MTSEKRELAYAIRMIASSVYPIDMDESRFRGPHSQAEALDVIHVLGDSGEALAKLRGILLNTGDTTIRRFSEPYFDGNGPHSTLDGQVLLDRVRYGLSTSSAVDQGGLPVAEARPIMEDIVQDVAMALLGETVTFKGGRESEVVVTDRTFAEVRDHLTALCLQWGVPVPQIRSARPSDTCDYTGQYEVRINVAAAPDVPSEYHAAHVFGHYLCSLHAAADEQEGGSATCDLVADAIARMAGAQEEGP